MAARQRLLISEDRVTISVDQSFGNCPQYIQMRRLENQSIQSAHAGGVIALGNRLTPRALDMVRRTDTCFIASASPNAGSSDPTEGADVNHRGGRPGFVRATDATEGTVLTLPDYVGNLAFNTLGNIAVNPRAGILLLDFESGDAVSVTGQATVIWEGAELADFAGAERLVQVRVEQAWLLEGALPRFWTTPEFAPQLDDTGVWSAVAAAAAARVAAETERTFRIADIVDESPTVQSYWLEPLGDDPLPSFQPGQYLPIRIPTDAGSSLRAVYSLSAAPDGKRYRLSVRAQGQAGTGLNNWLRRHGRVGLEVMARRPAGTFTLAHESRRPVALLGGGIGITPLVAMAQYLTGGTATRQRFPGRAIHIVHAVRNGLDRPLLTDLRALAARPNCRVSFVYSRPQAHELPVTDYTYGGRLDAAALQSLFPDAAEYDFYLCGPAGFMAESYEALRTLGVADERINWEAFGPDAPQRIGQSPSPYADGPPVDVATVTLVRSATTVRSKPGESLLQTLEQAEIPASASCRSGRCGTCETALIAGRITYPRPPSFKTNEHGVLLCVARPATTELTLVL